MHVICVIQVILRSAFGFGLASIPCPAGILTQNAIEIQLYRSKAKPDAMWYMRRRLNGRTISVSAQKMRKTKDQGMDWCLLCNLTGRLAVRPIAGVFQMYRASWLTICCMHRRPTCKVQSIMGQNSIKMADLAMETPFSTSPGVQYKHETSHFSCLYMSSCYCQI